MPMETIINAVLNSRDRIDCNPTFLPTIKSVTINMPTIATVRPSRFFSRMVASDGPFVYVIILFVLANCSESA